MMSPPLASCRFAQASNGPGCGGAVLVRVLSVVCTGAGVVGELAGCRVRPGRWLPDLLMAWLVRWAC